MLAYPLTEKAFRRIVAEMTKSRIAADGKVDDRPRRHPKEFR
jgi:hypothetical protein